MINLDKNNQNNTSNLSFFREYVEIIKYFVQK